MYVYKKGTKQLYEIISIRNDKNGYPQFLVYNFYDEMDWRYISAKNFVPII